MPGSSESPLHFNQEPPPPFPHRLISLSPDWKPFSSRLNPGDLISKKPWEETISRPPSPVHSTKTRYTRYFSKLGRFRSGKKEGNGHIMYHGTLFTRFLGRSFVAGVVHLPNHKDSIRKKRDGTSNHEPRIFFLRACRMGFLLGRGSSSKPAKHQIRRKETENPNMNH